MSVGSIKEQKIINHIISKVLTFEVRLETNLKQEETEYDYMISRIITALFQLRLGVDHLT